MAADHLCLWASLLQAVWTRPQAWIDYKQTQDQPHPKDGMKVRFRGIRIYPACSHRIVFVHNLIPPPPQKKAFYFSDSLQHCSGLGNKTAVGKSWNECLIIKTLSLTSTPMLQSVSHQGGCWRSGGHHAVTSTAAFPGQLSGSVDKADFNERFCSFGHNLWLDKISSFKRKKMNLPVNPQLHHENTPVCC